MELTEEQFIGDDAETVETLLDDIFTNASGDHTLEELDTTRYFESFSHCSCTLASTRTDGLDIYDRASLSIP